MYALRVVLGAVFHGDGVLSALVVQCALHMLAALCPWSFATEPQQTGCGTDQATYRMDKHCIKAVQVGRPRSIGQLKSIMMLTIGCHAQGDAEQPIKQTESVLPGHTMPGGGRPRAQRNFRSKA